MVFDPCAALHTPDIDKHQNQVKVLIGKTASSLDDDALKMLFVSVQKNNIELCVQYAIDMYIMFSLLRRLEIDLSKLDWRDRTP